MFPSHIINVTLKPRHLGKGVHITEGLFGNLFTFVVIDYRFFTSIVMVWIVSRK